MDVVPKCKNKWSTDPDDLDMHLIKTVIDCIVDPLCYIFNMSFTTGVFPCKMKSAKVIPLFKTGDNKEFNNYRPVSLVSKQSKILEKLFVSRLDSFIDKHKLLVDNQYGFRMNQSTFMALMEVTKTITGFY